MNTVFGVVMILTGLLVAMKVFGTRENVMLFISSLVFFSGVELLVISNYELILPFNFRILSVFAISAGALLVVYFNNLKRVVFLAGSAASAFLSWFSIRWFPNVTIDIPFLYSNRIVTTLVFLIIILALVILINKRIRNHPPEE